jgi:hypothetical protein
MQRPFVVLVGSAFGHAHSKRPQAFAGGPSSSIKLAAKLGGFGAIVPYR